MKLRNKKTGETAEIKLKLNESLPDAIRKTIEGAGWEEYEEPLIEDEKIRKAVRAWAGYNGVEEVYYFTNGVGGSRLDAQTVMICFYNEIEELKGWGKYTISELCGEEEE